MTRPRSPSGHPSRASDPWSSYHRSRVAREWTRFFLTSVYHIIVCTLIIAWRVFAEAPVVVAANRDEALDRPSTPPSAIPGDPAIVAPRDERAGGTWLGYNDHGLLVGISNRWTADDLEGERSRGQFVLDLLGSRTAGEGATAVEDAVKSATYAPFNLVVADAELAMVFEWDGALRIDELRPGVHVVLNAGWDDRFTSVPGRDEFVRAQVESSRYLRRLLAAEDDESVHSWLDRAADALADHESGVCVHRDDFGTRSSSLIALHADSTATYRFADGPPCRTDYRLVDGQI